MPGVYHDHILWFGVTIASLATIYAACHTIARLEETKDTFSPVKSLCIVSQDTEDEIDTKSLAVLSKHPSAHIRESAIKILVSRAARSSDFLRAVRADIDSADVDVVSGALSTMKLVDKYHPRAFAVRRESIALPTIEDWTNENAGTAEPGNENEFGWDLSHSTTGESASDSEGRQASEARPRQRDGSPEEQARRRRRREAIVLNEGDRPLTQEDIIQRRRTE